MYNSKSISTWPSRGGFRSRSTLQHKFISRPVEVKWTVNVRITSHFGFLHVFANPWFRKSCLQVLVGRMDVENWLFLLNPMLIKDDTDVLLWNTIVENWVDEVSTCSCDPTTASVEEWKWVMFASILPSAMLQLTNEHFKMGRRVWSHHESKRTTCSFMHCQPSSIDTCKTWEMWFWLWSKRLLYFF
jgi:hypothetical protein